MGKPDVFDMILLWKKVKSPEEILDGYWEYYQRSRIKKAPRPSLYIHSAKYEAGNNCTLKVYDKAGSATTSEAITVLEIKDPDAPNELAHGLGNEGGTPNQCHQ